MTNYTHLKSVIIGKRSFLNVAVVDVTGLHLTTFQIGKYTFQNAV